MSFAENLIYLRQHHGTTQESLAEKLGVSRQTVSKWEAGINFPETDKLLALCDLYHTNLDDLMRGSVHIANQQDTALYDCHMNRRSIAFACATVLILVGSGVFLLLGALDFPGNITVSVLLAFVVISSVIGIVAGIGHSEFKRRHPFIDPLYPEDVLDRFSRRYPAAIAVGVGLILLATIVLIGLSPEEGTTVVLGSVAFSQDILIAPFMGILALAVGLLVFASMQKSKYSRTEITRVSSLPPDEQALLERNTTPETIRHNHIMAAICGTIMILATIVFLVWGFVPGFEDFAAGGFDKFEFKEYLRDGQGGFAISWIAFPVGGLLCAIVFIIGSTFSKSNQQLIAEARQENPWLRVEETRAQGKDEPGIRAEGSGAGRNQGGAGGGTSR